MKLLILLISISQADTLNDAIEKAAIKYNVKVIRLKMIVCVETSCGKNVKVNNNKNGSKDFGPFQINTVTWNERCLELP